MQYPESKLRSGVDHESEKFNKNFYKEDKNKIKDRCFKLCIFLNIPVFEYGIESGKVFVSFYFQKKVSINKNVFYLKINKFDPSVNACFKYWLEIIDQMNAEYFILCDDIKVKNKILQAFTFPSRNIKFIKSNRISFKKMVAFSLGSFLWSNAAYAHLTTYLHAKKNNINRFWNIDADDTMFMIPPKSFVHFLSIITDYAEKNNINLFSLDMHHSFSNSKHWSYGITYVNNSNRILYKFKTMNQKDWLNYRYTELADEPFVNIDWITTWFRISTDLKIETFYINNIYFLHNCNPLVQRNQSLMLYKDGKIEYPVFKKLYNIDELMVSYVPIAKDDIKFEFDFYEEDSMEYMINNYVQLDGRVITAKNIFNNKY